MFIYSRGTQASMQFATLTQNFRRRKNERFIYTIVLKSDFEASFFYCSFSLVGKSCIHLQNTWQGNGATAARNRCHNIRLWTIEL